MHGGWMHGVPRINIEAIAAVGSAWGIGIGMAWLGQLN